MGHALLQGGLALQHASQHKRRAPPPRHVIRSHIRLTRRAGDSPPYLLALGARMPGAGRAACPQAAVVYRDKSTLLEHHPTASRQRRAPPPRHAIRTFTPLTAEGWGQPSLPCAGLRYHVMPFARLHRLRRRAEDSPPYLALGSATTSCHSHVYTAYGGGLGTALPTLRWAPPPRHAIRTFTPLTAEG
ncbi:hypothetical protein HNQ65_001310 [Prosthecobacter vanneervenii]|uniref:Uncharacterized protein n=1 Tax=Prosthecobacter vanneervenii TaxID=48466 RepID=A0A7W8DJ57_9BACT|nr:hypothetical protein [Prosthecobacter vanneervenii]